MILHRILLLLVFYGILHAVHGFWIKEMLMGVSDGDVEQVVKKDTAECTIVKDPLKKVPKPNVLCDENQFMMQLARLYIISPERIVLLLTKRSLPDTCSEVTEVLRRINNTLTSCIPLAPDNLYMRLISGLRYFNTIVCANPHNNNNKKSRDLTSYHNCVKELRDDLIDCEGPADWFEKSNESVVCPYYNDIADCNYIKTAMLCGLKPALLLRTFTVEVMKRTVGFKCKVSRSLPKVDDPMPAIAAKTLHTKFYLIPLLIMFNFIAIYI